MLFGKVSFAYFMVLRFLEIYFLLAYSILPFLIWLRHDVAIPLEPETWAEEKKAGVHAVLTQGEAKTDRFV